LVNDCGNVLDKKNHFYNEGVLTESVEEMMYSVAEQLVYKDNRTLTHAHLPRDSDPANSKTLICGEHQEISVSCILLLNSTTLLYYLTIQPFRVASVF